MCAVSAVGDEYRYKWAPPGPPSGPFVQPILPGSGAGSAGYTFPSPVSREEFDALKAEVLEMKQRLIEAKAQDIANGEPDCEMEDKVAILRQVADLVGVDLEEVFGPKA